MRTILPPRSKIVPESAKLVFQGQIFGVYQWQQKLYDGTEATFEMLKRPDTVQVLAIKDHKMVVVNESQPDSPHAYYGLPGGRHDAPEETELEAAQRELLEETGMSFQSWRLIGIVQPHAKLEWFVYTFLATGFEDQADIHLDAGEKIAVQLVDRDEALALAHSSRPGHLPLELLDQVGTIDELADLPQFGTAA